MIKINSLNKYFNKGRQNEIHVIDNVTLELPERGMVAIFGKSGCGKTTLLNTIGGLDKFESGTLSVDGNDIREGTDALRNKYVGYVFQNYNLNLGESCFDNVADALRLCGVTDKAVIESRTIAALKNVGMEKYAKRTPDTLSGGQQQRIAIARAIVKNPKIILADEPTGNLDETNTVLIMDLLRAIAKEHLVVLVTHELNLVDYYCDKVIELSDGKVASIRENERADGYTEKDKNDIFLGELERRDISDERAVIEYYGEAPSEPIRLKIVNHGGRLYVKVDNDNAQILDTSSEVKLREGVYEPHQRARATDKTVDMSALPPIDFGRTGRLFGLKSSIISGYSTNFKRNARAAKILRRCMILFAAVMVFMSAIFGTAIGNLSKIKSTYNHNVFYLYTDKPEISERLMAATEADTGIDYVRLEAYFSGGDEVVNFRVGNFETFDGIGSLSGFSANAVLLDRSLTEGMVLLAGRRDGLSEEEVLISSAVADVLLENSWLGYIENYDDLVGLISWSINVGRRSVRVAGVVESDESAIYFSSMALAKKLGGEMTLSSAYPANQYGYSVAEGKTTLLVSSGKGESSKLPTLNEKIKIQGVELEVERVLYLERHYSQYLKANGIEKIDEETYLTQNLLAENPALTPGTDEFATAYEEYRNHHYYEYYDYYYLQIDDFMENLCLLGEFDGWLWQEKGIEEAAYRYYSAEYSGGLEYKKLHGTYPVLNQDEIPDVLFELDEYYKLYEQEFYSNHGRFGFYPTSYLVADSDYITISKQIGETHPTAKYEEPMNLYSVIHSTDPEKTEAWLLSEFGDMENDYYQTLYTPNGIFEVAMAEQRSEIVAYLVAILALLGIMSVCMYFMMHSSLMNRIKEVGIYRAIGVSRKNLIFKFLVESLVIFALTVLVGYVITSIAIGASVNSSTLMEEVFYYPAWLSACVFAVLFALCILSGILPILSLLRKTPSEILAKYDI